MGKRQACAPKSERPVAKAKAKAAAKAKAEAGSGSLTKKVAPKTRPKPKSQGVQFVPGMTCSQFDLVQFCKGAMDTLRCTPVGGKVMRTASACSGAGSPAIVMKHIVSEAVEVMSCEINPAAAHACLTNCSPKHCQTDIFCQTKQSQCFCYVCNRACPVPQASDDIDVLVVGFPCNPNSMLNCKRFKTDATAEPDAQVLVATADLIRQCQPKVFVLENVDGINKKRGGQGAESDCTVLAWIMQVLRD